MIASLISLIGVAVGFTALIVYVYRPSQRKLWRQRGITCLDLEDDAKDAILVEEGDRCE